MIDRITQALQYKKLVACIGLDIQKAFDTVDHEISFDNMDYVGIRNAELNFFKCYYLDRKQFIKINGKISTDGLTILRSVMQGTVLNVIGFLIFINDLPHATKFASNFIFADNLNSIIQAYTYEELENMVQGELDNLMKYYSVNKLSDSSKEI